jgi:hypothetical protein
MTIEQALVMVKAAGYRVSKPKTVKATNPLNAIGRPYGQSFDPNYKMKYRRNVISELCRPMPKNTPYVRVEYRDGR